MKKILVSIIAVVFVLISMSGCKHNELCFMKRYGILGDAESSKDTFYTASPAYLVLDFESYGQHYGAEQNLTKGENFAHVWLTNGLKDEMIKFLNAQEFLNYMDSKGFNMK